jgi:hypothetical protein
MDRNAPEYLNLIETHLSALTTDGRQYLNVIAGAFNVLEAGYRNKIALTDDDKEEMFTRLKNAIEQYLELMNWSLEERIKFSESRQDK